VKYFVLLTKTVGFLVGLGGLALIALALAGPLGWPFELFASWPYLIAAIGICSAIGAGLCRWPRLGTLVFAGALTLVAIAMASPGDLTRAKPPPIDTANHHLIWGNMLGMPASVRELMTRAYLLDQAVLAGGEMPWQRDKVPISARAGLNRARGGSIGVEGCSPTGKVLNNQGDYGDGALSRSFGLKVACADYTLFAIHLTNPLRQSGLRFTRRNEELVMLANAVRTVDGPIVVIGDFNTAPNALPFSRFIKAANVAHTSCGGRWLPTWRPLRFRARFHDGNPLTGIPIDHLFTRNIDVVSCSVGQDFGSDHLPLVVELNTRQ
jgi:hypothetical protein